MNYNFKGLNEAETKCGWWCRNKARIGAVVLGFVTGGPVGAAAVIVASFAQEGAWERTSDFSTLDPYEEGQLNNLLANIENWTANFLKTRIEVATTKLNVLEANLILRDIALFKHYYGNKERNPLSLYSNEAMTELSLMITETSKLYEDLVLQAFEGYKITTLKSGTYSLSPLFKMQNNEAFNHVAIVERSLTPIDIISDVLPIETNPTEPDTVATTTQQSKTTGLNWILYALAGFGIYKAVTKK